MQSTWETKLLFFFFWVKFSTSYIHIMLLTCHCFREEEMQELNRRTNSRMAWLGFLSLAICLSVAGLQLWHLKNFFERKKLLWFHSFYNLVAFRHMFCVNLPTIFRGQKISSRGTKMLVQLRNTAFYFPRPNEIDVKFNADVRFCFSFLFFYFFVREQCFSLIISYFLGFCQNVVWCSGPTRSINKREHHLSWSSACASKPGSWIPVRKQTQPSDTDARASYYWIIYAHLPGFGRELTVRGGRG